MKKLEIKIGGNVLAYNQKLTDGKLRILWQQSFMVLKNYSPPYYILVDPETKTRYRRSDRHLRPIGP